LRCFIVCQTNRRAYFDHACDSCDARGVIVRTPKTLVVKPVLRSVYMQLNAHRSEDSGGTSTSYNLAKHELQFGEAAFLLHDGQPRQGCHQTHYSKGLPEVKYLCCFDGSIFSRTTVLLSRRFLPSLRKADTPVSLCSTFEGQGGRDALPRCSNSCQSWPRGSIEPSKGVRMGVHAG
jgi:hypothetical protein